VRLLSLMFVAGVLVAACQSSSMVRDDAGGGYRQLQGGSLVLKQTVTIPAGKARVFVQAGRLREARNLLGGTFKLREPNSLIGGAFDHYRPHCALEIDAIKHDGFTITPDNFLISRVQHSVTQVVMGIPLRLAALNLADGSNRKGSGGYYEGYHLWLTSARQPAVRRLSCYGSYAGPSDLMAPTLAEIETALGDLAEIRF